MLLYFTKPSGLAVSIWTGAWHIARHINLRRAIQKRRKFHSETKIQSLAILSCTTEYRVLFAFVPFSVAIWVVYEGGLKNQARDFILLRQTRRALKGAPRQVKARAEARARSRASNGQAWLPWQFCRFYIVWASMDMFVYNEYILIQGVSKQARSNIFYRFYSKW